LFTYFLQKRRAKIKSWCPFSVNLHKHCQFLMKPLYSYPNGNAQCSLHIVYFIIIYISGVWNLKHAEHLFLFFLEYLLFIFWTQKLNTIFKKNRPRVLEKREFSFHEMCNVRRKLVPESLSDCGQGMNKYFCTGNGKK